MKYDMREKLFSLNTESYARIKCDMDFDLYPYDTQMCNFIIVPDKNLTYQACIDDFTVSSTSTECKENPLYPDLEGW